jgi:hypothetical protein
MYPGDEDERMAFRQGADWCARQVAHAALEAAFEQGRANQDVPREPVRLKHVPGFPERACEQFVKRENESHEDGPRCAACGFFRLAHPPAKPQELRALEEGFEEVARAGSKILEHDRGATLEFVDKMKTLVAKQLIFNRAISAILKERL